MDSLAHQVVDFFTDELEKHCNDQSRFGLRRLQGSKAPGIHTVMETCGHVGWAVWESLLPYLDLILYDLKETDPGGHKRRTSVSNDLVLDNLRRLANSSVSLIVP